ncbi:MAG: disulfide bond formation protein B [Gammaproteobacteria bacterium]
MFWLTERGVFSILFLLSAGLLGFGYYLEVAGGLEPCPLCLLQRLFFGLIGLTSFIAVLHNAKLVGIGVYSALIALFSSAGAIVAGRQVWLQHLPPDQVPECGTGLSYMFETLPLGEVLLKIFKGSSDCAEVTWRFMGLSIPEWALAMFAILFLISAVQMFRSAAATRPAARI